MMGQKLTEFGFLAKMIQLKAGTRNSRIALIVGLTGTTLLEKLFYLGTKRFEPSLVKIDKLVNFLKITYKTREFGQFSTD